METVSCAFSLLCLILYMSGDVENENEQRSSKFGVGGANLVWVEQIWSGCSKFGVGGADVGRTVWRVADNLEKTLLCKFLFSWAKFLTMKLMTDT